MPDLHRAYAARLFGVPIEQVTDVQRATAKSRAYVYLYSDSPLPPELSAAMADCGMNPWPERRRKRIGDATTFGKRVTRPLYPHQEQAMQKLAAHPLIQVDAATYLRQEINSRKAMDAIDRISESMLDAIIDTRAAGDALAKARAELAAKPDHDTAAELQERRSALDHIARTGRSLWRVIKGGRDAG